MVPKHIVQALFKSCVFDACALEGSKQQNEYRCHALDQFASLCYEAAEKLRLTRRGFRVNWRGPSRCRMHLTFCDQIIIQKFDWSIFFSAKKCGKNEVYGIRSECPKTCLNPVKKYNCGILKPVEGCHCRRGFVRNSKEQCVRRRQCGCRLPDGSGVLHVSQSIYSFTFNPRLF